MAHEFCNFAHLYSVLLLLFLFAWFFLLLQKITFLQVPDKVAGDIPLLFIQLAISVDIGQIPDLR